MKLINDDSCGWLKNLTKRSNFKTIDQNFFCDYLIVGGGYTGLSAARKLGKIHKNKKIIIVEAQLAGEGASARNSGYLVDTTLNDGFVSNTNLDNYKKKVEIYDKGIKAVKNFIREYQVNCDWNECGKYFVSSKIIDKKKVMELSNTLSSLNFKNKILYQDELSQKIGTDFYKVGLYTNGGILLHPGKLVRSMIDTLPENVSLFENSPLIKWKKINNKIHCTFENNFIETDKIIFCTNGFLRSLGVKKEFTFPLTLTASMTRQLTEDEFKSIGEPKEWGLLPIRPMGATIRLTKDKRILIRNTAEVRNPFLMRKKDLNERINFHSRGIEKRFPVLPNNIIDSSWSGIVCRSQNSSQLFEKIDDNIYAAGCYNGSGIGVGTLFGEQIALMASNQQTEEIKVIQNIKKPNRLPPQPFLYLGIQAKLFFERIKARSEI